MTLWHGTIDVNVNGEPQRWMIFDGAPIGGPLGVWRVLDYRPNPSGEPYYHLEFVRELTAEELAEYDLRHARRQPGPAVWLDEDGNLVAKEE